MKTQISVTTSNDSPVRFKSCFHVGNLNDTEVLLVSECETHLLSGATYSIIAPLLGQGNYSADELVNQLSTKLEPAEIYYALHRLESAGLIEYVDSTYTREFAAFCQLMKCDPKNSLEKLCSKKICVRSCGNVDIQSYISALSSVEISISSSSKEADFTLVITEDYLHPDLEKMHEEFHRQGHLWAMVKPHGMQIWMGPIFNLHKKGCWKCLVSRIKHNRFEQGILDRVNGEGFFSFPTATLPCTKEMAVQFATMQLFKWIVRTEMSTFQEKLLIFDVLANQIGEHTLVPLPYCNCCGEKKIDIPVRLDLCSRKKETITDGGTRSCSREETFKKHDHLISPILGLLSSMERVSAHPILHVYHSGVNRAISNKVKGIKWNSLRSSCSGKGETEIQAKVSCLCEGLERYCGCLQGNEKTIRGSYQALAPVAIHPHNCLLFSENQYKNREELNKTPYYSVSPIPEPYSSDMEIDWKPVWSLTHQTTKYLPASFCYYDFVCENNICRGDSNGNASGNNLEEAILQGLFELIERDSVAIWWYNRIQRPSVDLSRFHHPFFDSLINAYRDLNREVWVLDITSDINIPVYAAFSRRLDQKEENIMFGFGCHLNSKIAISRALAEMSQMVSSMGCLIKNEFQKEKTCEIPVWRSWMQEATLDNQPYLQPSPILPSKNVDDYAYTESDDLLKDVIFCQKLLETMGMEMLVLDQSRVEIDLKVVKVIVPGLVHFWPRFAPGRLYDVPVKMGWQKKVLKESELNPISMFW